MSKEPRGITNMMEDLKDDLMILERSMAGYNTLTRALETVNGNLPPGERPKGLPVFEYPGTADDVHVIRVCSDLNDVDPAYLPHVLAPLCNAHSKMMHRAAVQIKVTADEIIGMIEMATTQTNPGDK